MELPPTKDVVSRVKCQVSGSSSVVFFRFSQVVQGMKLTAAPTLFVEEVNLSGAGATMWTGVHTTDRDCTSQEPCAYRKPRLARYGLANDRSLPEALT